MSAVKQTLLLITILDALLYAHGYRILGLLTSPSYSHFIIQNTLMVELAKRGHEVTVIGPYSKPNDNLIDNLHNIHIKYEPNADYQGFLDKILTGDGNRDNLLHHYPLALQVMLRETNKTLNSVNFQKFLTKQNQWFDLVIIGWFFNDFQLGVAAHFKCPTIILSTFPSIKILRDYVGNSWGISYTPHFLLNYVPPMTFWQRLNNYFIAIIEILFTFYANYKQNQFYTENFPIEKGYPTFEEVRKNVSIVLLCQHFSQEPVQELTPALIEIGGIHINTIRTPLPETIQQFLDNATDGAILFSMGSNLKSVQLPKDKLNIILKTFSKLKQKILWKWEDDSLTNKPDNVMITKWMPQDDVLAHSNIKLFISHGGLGSITEAKYHGVPVLGIPVFGDQKRNIQTVQNDGWGLLLPYDELSEEQFLEKILELLQNKNYAETIQYQSKIYKDRPQTPLETAVYWVEYVLRYNGAKHLKSSAVHLNFFQYHSLDVMIFLVTIILCIFLIVRSLIRYCYISLLLLLFKHRKLKIN